jgi:16S rRNA (cytosine1402-N4)-methyltransferase
MDETLTLLQVENGGVYVDATFGRGGHSRAMLAALGSEGRLLVIDRDPEAVAEARRLALEDPRVLVEHAEFARLAELARRHGFCGKVAGVLLDLGVSSPQLDAPERGFSFYQDGPLDMRMNPSPETPTAAAWLARATESEIAKVLKEFGEERYARRIANAIVRARMARPIRRTSELAEVVAAANPSWEQDKHPATRTFQALRILVNRELDQIESVLGQALEVLAAGGRLVVISFHSLEDRLVKRFFKRGARGDSLPPRLPVTADTVRPQWRLLGGPIRPSAQEIEANPRARSAVLRAGEKLW